MKIKKDLLGAIGLNEYAPIKSLFVVVIFLAAIGIFADGIVDIIETQSFGKLFISIGMFLVVYVMYLYLGRQELKIVKELSTNKEVMILVTPSNVDHLRKIIGKHKLHTIHILKEKRFPRDEVYSEIKAFLKSREIELKEYILTSLENPREIHYKFREILAHTDETKEITLNISTGKASTSIILFELAKFENIGVEYLSSAYDETNQPIEGSEQNYNIDFYKEFSR
ncbi:hypothetical protein KKC13_07180 [bacterium]|nr:hypothetical protein [bacterium]MBU1956920.1 hypothetical protein [bacterium]